MTRVRQSTYRPPAVKTWSVEDKDGKATAVVTRYDKGQMKVWTPDLGLTHEGVEIKPEHLAAFAQAVAEAYTWTDES